jgi:nucleoside-diphosphate-sugar epimerase
MARIAVFGGTGYLASLIKNQNNVKKNKYTFFSRKKNTKNYINFLSLKKNLDILKNFDFIIHLAGPNQDQLKKNKRLIEKKNKITSMICNVCLVHNIKLIYISSIQVYKDYGKSNLSINSKINLKNPYSKSHYDSEKIILEKFLKYKNMFTILRMGNVFGFTKCNNSKDIDSNLIHSLCNMALKKEKILINNGSIRRTFIPSQIFVKVINSIIKKNFFENLIINISYKNLNLKDIAYIIQKRSKLIFNLTIDVIIKKFSYNKDFSIFTNQNFKFNPLNKKFYNEIDQILKLIKKTKLKYYK